MMREGRNPMVVSGVVGDVLEPFTATVELRAYNNGKIVISGGRIKPSQIVNRPRVEIGGGDDFRILYTLVMVDADAPSPSNPHLKEYLHWLILSYEITLVTDIPGNTDASFGREIMSYESPQPAVGIHRLVLVLYRQPVGRQSVTAPGQRHNFNNRQFSQLYNLGSPVAALYYNCHRENGTGCRRS